MSHEPDDFQKAWHSPSAQTQITINMELLLREVRRHQQEFRAKVFWRDCTEIGLATLMIPGWIYLGITFSLPWTWYLSIPVFAWWIGFMLYYRMRLKLPPSQPDNSLVECVEHSLVELEHQIWLLRNVVWWYLLPPTVAILAFFAQVIFGAEIPLIPGGGWQDILARGIVFSWMSLFILAIYYFVYAMNQYAVRSQLQPRRQELLALRASLTETTEESSGNDVSSDFPILTSGEYAPCSRRSVIFAGLGAIGILFLGLVSIMYIGHVLDHDDATTPRRGYALKSPFEAVRWNDEQPEVQVDGEWFQLISLNDIPSTEIVGFSKKTFEDQWRKRFEEDLVELLTRMGHPPEKTDYKTKLVVESLKTSEQRVFEDVLMTEENRYAIKAAAMARSDAMRE